MKIVVVGGHGLIGSKVATKLCAQGHDVSSPHVDQVSIHSPVKDSPTPSPGRMS